MCPAYRGKRILLGLIICSILDTFYSQKTLEECGISNVHIASCGAVDAVTRLSAQVLVPADVNSNQTCTYLLMVQWGDGTQTNEFFGAVGHQLVPEEDDPALENPTIRFARILQNYTYNRAGSFDVRVHFQVFPWEDDGNGTDPSSALEIPNVFPTNAPVHATLDISQEYCRITQGGTSAASTNYVEDILWTGLLWFFSFPLLLHTLW